MTALTPGFSYPPARGTIAFLGCKDDSSDVTAGQEPSLLPFLIILIRLLCILIHLLVLQLYGSVECHRRFHLSHSCRIFLLLL